jgi:hypothetical protein
MLDKITRVVFSRAVLYFTFALGIVSLFLPHLSGWGEIVFPSIAYFFLILYYAWSLFLLFALTFLGLSFVLAFVKGWSRQQRKTSLILLVILLLAWQTVYPLWMTLLGDSGFLATTRRVDSFPLGGRTRLIWAGGANNVRNDALTLLEVTSDEGRNIPSSEWPQTLRRLGITRISIDQETQTVIMYIPSAHFFDPDTFGYIACTCGVPDPEVLHADGYRSWQITEGLTFFEIW